MTGGGGSGQVALQAFVVVALLEEFWAQESFINNKDKNSNIDKRTPGEAIMKGYSLLGRASQNLQSFSTYELAITGYAMALTDKLTSGQTRWGESRHHE